MNDKVIFPGTFDPFTNGHKDLVERAARMFGSVVVGVAENKRKSPFFSLAERLNMVENGLSHLKNVQVRGFDNLLIDFAKQIGARAVIRGLRVVSDFEYEFQLANMNRRLNVEIETLFLTPAEQYSFISSTLVREIAVLGGDVSSFVPESIAKCLKERFK